MIGLKNIRVGTYKLRTPFYMVEPKISFQDARERREMLFAAGVATQLDVEMVMIVRLKTINSKFEKILDIVILNEIEAERKYQYFSNEPLDDDNSKEIINLINNE